MKYQTFTAVPQQPVEQPAPTDGISFGGVATLVLAAAVFVVIKRMGKSAGGKTAKAPWPPPVAPLPGGLPTVSLDELRGGPMVKAPAAPPDEAEEGKGLSMLAAPAVKAQSLKMDIPYELMQKIQKGPWAAMCKARKLPGLERGEIEKTPYGVAVHVRFCGALDFPTVQRGVDQLETGLDVPTGTIRLRKGATAGRGILDIRIRDPLADGTPWEQPSVPVRLAHPLKLAVTPFGDTLELSLKQRIGVFGGSGFGKSCVQRLIGAHVAQAIDADLEVWDLKFGIEGKQYSGKARIITTVADAADRVDHLLNVEYPRRAAKMRELGVSMWDETPWDKALVVLIDEGNVVVRGFGDWRPEAEEGEPRGAKGGPLKDLFTLVEQGRALGVYFVYATQLPKATNLPTEIRSQLNATVCMKLRTSEEAAIVFKDDVREGWSPHDLLGPGWLLVKDDVHTNPVDAKAIWLSVDELKSVPVSGPFQDKPSLPTRAPGQSLTETVPDTVSASVSLDKGVAPDTDRTDVATDVWLALSVSEKPQGVSELARRTRRSKSAVHAALKRMTEDCRVVQYGAGYRLRTTEEDEV